MAPVGGGAVLAQQGERPRRRGTEGDATEIAGMGEIPGGSCAGRAAAALVGRRPAAAAGVATAGRAGGGSRVAASVPAPERARSTAQ